MILVMGLITVYVVNAKVEKPQKRNWYSCMKLPTREEIDIHNQTSKKRSPYICAWLNTNVVGH